MPCARSTGDEERLAMSQRRTPRRVARWACLASLSWLASAQAQVPEPAPLATPAPEGSSATPPAPAPAAPVPAATAQAESDADALLAELGGELEQPVLTAVEQTTGLALYGFADVGFYKYFLPAGNLLRTRVNEDGAFTVGNLNTYLSGELGNGFRSLIEVRFTYLPNCSRTITNGNLQRVGTETADYTGAGRPRNTGSIFIERAYIEYSASSALNLRVGSWLTPYGLWNEDHGSPTIIPVGRPYMIWLELMPERQTGLLASGSFYASESVTLGYQVGLSNGRGPIADYGDMDENKALTLRLQLHHHGDGALDLGAFGYGGRSTDVEESIVTTDTRVLVDEQIREQYDEIAWGFDARYVLGGLHLQSELIVHERAYTARGRPLRLGTQYQPDERRFGGYVLGGYRFDWLGLMPYATVDYFSYLNNDELTRPPTRDVITDYSIGLNSRPTTNVTLKLEGKIGFFFVDNAKGSAFENPLPAVEAQIAWAF
jgi:hypothetical protein